MKGHLDGEGNPLPQADGGRPKRTTNLPSKSVMIPANQPFELRVDEKQPRRGCTINLSADGALQSEINSVPQCLPLVAKRRL